MVLSEEINLVSLTDKMIDEIFKDINIRKLTMVESSYLVYKYMIENMGFDYSLWEQTKRGIYDIELKDLVANVFIKHKGHCSALAQAYKILLERLGIPVLAVTGTDEGDIHQFNLVQRGYDWSFDDVTRGIIMSGNKDAFFDYDDLTKNDQTIYYVLREDCYDKELGINIDRKKIYLDKRSLRGHYELPKNICSTKQSIKSL